ncbi:MAG: hypothetical protein ABIQ73_18240 [Acidimicrobiales bacterium]
MRSDTQSVMIQAATEAVVQFVGDGANLPRWAIGFAKSVEPRGDEWVVTTGSGDRVPTRVVVNAAAGTVDFVMSPAPGVEGWAWSRAVAAEQGSWFSFTQVQSPGMPDAVFDAQVAAVGHELVALKALLEVACPL